MSKHLSATIYAQPPECKNSNVRPGCPKCGGLLVPETAFRGDGEGLVLVSVGCVSCGERIYKEHTRRLAKAADLTSGPAQGSKAHKGVETC